MARHAALAPQAPLQPRKRKKRKRRDAPAEEKEKEMGRERLGEEDGGVTAAAVYLPGFD
jgi:hypothetical protein